MFLVFLSSFFLPPERAIAQTIASVRPSHAEQSSQGRGEAPTKISLYDALELLSKKHGVSFEFNDRLIKNKKVDPVSMATDEKLEQTLFRILSPLSIKYEHFDKKTILIYQSDRQKTFLKEEADASEGRTFSQDISTISPSRRRSGATLSVAAGDYRLLEETEVRGVVTDENGERLPGVSILIEGTTRGTTTDGNGVFKIAVSDRNTKLIFSFVGFLSQEVVPATRPNLT